MRVELADSGEVVRHRRRQVIASPQPPDAIDGLGRLVGLLAVERITPPARMRVDVVPGLVLAIEVVEQFEQYEVLENVGVIAGVEGVTVAEHVGFPMSAGILAPPVVAQNPWRISNIAHRARVFMLHCSCYDARPDCREPPASDIQ